MKLWHRHRWQIEGPVGLGGNSSVAFCRCLDCPATRERVLDGREVTAAPIEVPAHLQERR